MAKFSEKEIITRMIYGDVDYDADVDWRSLITIEYLITRIYGGRMISPFIQLATIEQAAEDTGNTYNSYSRQIRKATKGINRCIACLKKCDKPCHTINMDNLSYIRKANKKAKGGTAKGSTYDNKQNPKGKSIDALLKAMDEMDLSWKQKKSIKDNFKELQPELLTLFTGMVANTFEGFQITKTEDLITRGLVELLPDRDKDFVMTGKPPKYGSKIDIKDYMTFWSSANQMGLLTEVFKDIRIGYGEMGRILSDHNPTKETKAEIPFNTVGAIPYPCEKDKDWHNYVDIEKAFLLPSLLKNIKWAGDGWAGGDGTMNKRIAITLEEIKGNLKRLRKIKTEELLEIIGERRSVIRKEEEQRWLNLTPKERNAEEKEKEKKMKKEREWDVKMGLLEPNDSPDK